MNNQDLIPAKFYFDHNPKKTFKGLHNPLLTWNGWANPLIHSSSIKSLVNAIHVEGENEAKILPNGDLCIHEINYDIQIISPKIIEGEIYYDFFYFGYTFQAK